MIGIIGTGNMGGAIANGLLQNKVPTPLYLYNRTFEKMDSFQDTDAYLCRDINDLLANCRYIILAIKPFQYEDFLKEFQQELQDKVVISIAAGINSHFLSRFIPNFILTMPNTPCKYQMGLTSLVRNRNVDQKDFLFVKEVFKSVGVVVEITEQQLPVMITMAGSSPAYNFLFIEAMAQFGLSHGLDYQTSYQIASQVMESSAKLVLKDNISPLVQVDKVCSKNGTTIQAVDHFKLHGLDELVNNAMQACFNRASDMMDEYK